MLYKLLVRRAAVIISALIGIRVRQKQELRWSAACDFLEYTIKSPDIIKPTAQSDICKFFFCMA